MNQGILFSFAIINHILIFISGCVHFENDNDGECSQLDDNIIEEKYSIQCDISNPLAKIESITCEKKTLDTITVSMVNLEDLENFCLRNNETVMKLLHLFNHTQYSMSTFVIELTDLLSSSDQVELAINKQWITTLFGHHRGFYTILQLEMTTNDWSRTNLTIHPDVNSTKLSQNIQLHLKRGYMSCTADIAPPFLYTLSYMTEPCRDFITYIDQNGKAVPWPATIRTKKRISTTTPFGMGWLWVSKKPSRPFRPIIFETTTIQKRRSSSGLWAYLLSPTFIIIIGLMILIYCLMKKSRSQTLPQTFSQPVMAPPVYTSNVPIYHPPPYSQK